MTSDAPVAADGHPQLGSVHKNGDRRYGIIGLYASVLASRGTPMLSSLYHSTVTEQIRSVRVGDKLRVQWDGDHWWALSPRGRVGRPSWPKGLRTRTGSTPKSRRPYDFDNGTLHVQEVTLDTAGDVVDCGGYVIPDNYRASEWPMTPMPDPHERELHVTVNLPNAKTSTTPSTPPRPRSLLRRLIGGKGGI